MHREIRIEKYGDAAKLVLRDQRAELQPKPEEVLIDVKYSGVNFADIQMRMGLYPDAPPRPFVPGYEVSGIVEAVGSSVSGLVPGDRVLAGTYFGGYSSKVSVPKNQVFKLPSSFELEKAAALPVSYFTARLALIEMGRVREGDRVLIECATGGVGTIAIQMAKSLGAEVVGLTTTPSKKAYIESYGAQAFTVEELEADPSIARFDFVLNASGGRSISKQLKRLDLTGRIVCMGLNASVGGGRANPLRVLKTVLGTPIFPVLSLMNKNRGVYGLNALRVLEDAEWVERLTKALEADLVRLGLDPHVDRVFPCEEVKDAHLLLENKAAKGKVLIGWS
jgi:synaptic vesicle membrane protein VAT-1